MSLKKLKYTITYDKLHGLYDVVTDYTRFIFDDKDLGLLHIDSADGLEGKQLRLHLKASYTKLKQYVKDNRL